jgi:hypothetical protein
MAVLPVVQEKKVVQPQQQLQAQPIVVNVEPLPKLHKKNCEVWTITDLPSKFKGYPVDKIEIRSFTLGELKYLSSEGLSDSQIIDTYREAIRNIDPAELSYPDLLFIASHISVVTSEAQEWSVETICKECGQSFTDRIGKDKFFSFEELKIPTFPLVVELNGVECHFDLPRVKDREPIAKACKDVEEMYHGLVGLAHIIRNLDTGDAYDLLKSITDLEEIALLEEIQTQLFHGVLPVKLLCSHCQKEAEYSVELEVSTVKPFREHGHTLADRIKYGVGK